MKSTQRVTVYSVFVATHDEGRVPPGICKTSLVYSNIMNPVLPSMVAGWKPQRSHYETQLRPPVFARWWLCQRGSSVTRGIQGGEFFRRHPAGNQFVEYFWRNALPLRPMQRGRGDGRSADSRGAPCVAQQHAAKSLTPWGLLWC